MGAWGVLALDNDTANDWAYGLDDVEDLSLVESALNEVVDVGGDYLDQDIACNVLAACEVLARLRGEPCYRNAHTEKVDAWVAAHELVPQPELLARASDVIDRILGEKSELRELWDEGDGTEWREAVENLRQRLRV